MKDDANIDLHRCMNDLRNSLERQREALVRLSKALHVILTENLVSLNEKKNVDCKFENDNILN